MINFDEVELSLIYSVAAVTPYRMLNFYSYELFVPRACARDHSPRRSNIH